MAGEAKLVATTQATLIASGAQLANGSYSTDAISLAQSAAASFPQANFVLKAAFSAALGAGVVVELYRRDINIVSTDEGPVPSASYPFKYVGNFPITSGVSTTVDEYPADGPIELNKVGDQEFTVKDATGQTMLAGWSLYATPWSLVPGA